MFSYRHAFHAGNHADVLKHVTLIALLRHLTQKDTALTVIDTHAGAGLYRLDEGQAATSGEAQGGIARLWGAQGLCPPLDDYVSLVRAFNAEAAAGGGTSAGSKGALALRMYPGSPLIVQRLLRPQDKLHLFELHSTDVPLLERNVQHLHAGRQVQVHASDGFAATKALLPPPSRRGLVLLDPSYEIKTDYARTAAAVADGLERFATGSYAVWVPQLARLDAQHLPDKLKRMAERAGRPWLHAALAVRAPGGVHSGLHASSMLVINPPYTLRATLRRALVQLHELLAQDTHAGYAISSQ